MSADANRLAAWLDRLPRIAAVIAAAAGVLVLLGWLFGVDALKSIVPGLTFMKANTALGFVLSGVALWDIQTGRQGDRLRLVSRICAGLVLLTGLLTLGEYLTGVSFGIDQMLIRETTSLPGDIPGRMAINTAVSFAALGAALLLLSKGGVAAIHALALIPAVLAGSALIGYGFDVEEFLRARLNYTPMSLPAAAVFVLLAFGIVTARPDYPLRRILTSSGAAGSTARRLLPALIGFAVAAGWMILYGLQAGYINDTLALALFTATIIAGGSAMVLWNSGMLFEEAAQRERLEKSLRENEEQLNTIIRFLPVGLWILDAEGKIVFGNDTAQRIWGGVRYVSLEGLGEYKGWRLDSGKLIGPHEWAGARAVEKGETSIEEEIEIESFDGTRKIILDSAVPLRRSDGSIRGAVTINQDITERKRSEEELRAASLYARSLLEASLDPLVTISPEGKITDVNEATVEATGVPRRLMIGSDFSNYFTEPDKARAGYQEVFAKGYVTDYPLSLRHVSSKVTDVLYNATVYRDEKGEVAGVFAAARDITGQQLAKEALRSSEERFRALSDATTEGVLIHEKGRIVEVNRRMEELLGRPRADLIGKAVLDLVSPAWRDMVSVRVAKPEDTRVEFAFARPDGAEVIVSGLGHDCIYQGRPMRIAAYRDITLERRSEEELRKYHERLEELVHERTTRLEAANKELESFAYSVSHDLRVPLRAIDGFSRLVLTKYEEKLDDEGRRLLNVVRDNAKRMGQLIDDILAFSRVGKLELSISEADMEALVRDVWQELVPSIAGRDVRMDIKPLPVTRGDPAMLRQVWSNLLGNAVKFTQPRPAAQIEIEGKIEGAECIYCVRDNGVGFDQQYVGKLFDIFQRLHGAEEFEGTGIGLAIVKRIVTRHGGRVWAEGKVGEGAAIYFALPHA